MLHCIADKTFGTAPGTMLNTLCVYTATGDTNITDTKLLYISIFTE